MTCIFLTPLPQAGCYTRFIFKQRLTGLNSVFPPLRLVAIPTLKLPDCPTISPGLRENICIHTFPKGII